MPTLQRKVKVLKKTPIGAMEIEVLIKAPSMSELTLLEYALVGVKQEFREQIRALKGMADAATNNQ